MQDKSKINSLYERGLEKTRAGDMARAMEYFAAVLQIDPNHADAHFHRGYILMRNGELKGAAFHFFNALKVAPNHPNAAMMQEMLKRAKQMSTRPAQPTADVSASSVTAEEQPFAESQISTVSPAVTDDSPTVNSRMFIERGIQLYENDQVEEAIDTFIEALKIDPENADAYINLGAIYHAFDEDELAHEYFKTALALAPDHPDAPRMRELLRITEERSNTRRGFMAESANE